MRKSRIAPTRMAATARSLIALVVGMTVGVSAARGQTSQTTLPATGDVMRGWRVFFEKKCVDCHAVWDHGGRVGPDLGRLRTGRLSGGQLAGVMWNHIPKMLGQMQHTGRLPTTLSQQDMADLFALIFFVRQLDEPGDPVRGEQILIRKGCGECHSTDSSEGSIGPDLAQWGKYANPVVWAQLMWEHAPMMEEAMRRSGMTWPKLEGTDLVHIVAYVRSAGISGEKTYLRPGSVGQGLSLFHEKKCDTCHPGSGPDLAASADLPTSMSALASRMWNHSPEMTRVMREQAVERQPISAQELADILAYVLLLGNLDRGGDATRGERVFAQKGCVQCHNHEEMAEGGPTVQRLGQDAAPVDMAAAMWNHGKTMLEQMTEAGISWPVFNEHEMVDLLAYLKTAESEAGGTTGD